MNDNIDDNMVEIYICKVCHICKSGKPNHGIKCDKCINRCIKCGFKHKNKKKTLKCTCLGTKCTLCNKIHNSYIYNLRKHVIDNSLDENIKYNNIQNLCNKCRVKL